MLDRMKTLTAVTAGFLVLATLVPPTSALAQEAVRIGTSSVGSNIYTLAVGAGEVINKKGKINTTVESVGGSSATVRGLGRKKIEFGLANAFAAVSAYNGTYGFKKSGRVGILLAVQGGRNYRAIMLRKGAKVKSVKDLEGRTIVGKRRPLPETELITKALIKVFNLNASKIKVVATTNTGQAVKALVVGSVDGAVLPMSPGTAIINKPFSNGVLEFLHIPAAKRDAMLKLLPPLIFAARFEAGAFEGLKRPVEVFAMNTLFITRPGNSDDLVYKVVKSILENNKLFVSYHHQAREWTLKNTLTNFQLPFHPGAIRYFKEVGAWTPALAAKQKKLTR